MSDLNRCTQVTPEVHEEIEKLFQYAPWDAAQRESGEMVRTALREAYEVLIERVPPSPTRTRALNHLIDARLLANTAISFKGAY